MKPILLGYQTVHIDTSAYQVRTARRELAAFAQREGYALTDVFLESAEENSFAALTAVIESARNPEVAAIAVPTSTDLGPMPRAQQETRQRLERESGVPVMVVDPNH